jgi:hypothetical protein
MRLGRSIGASSIADRAFVAFRPSAAGVNGHVLRRDLFFRA